WATLCWGHDDDSSTAHGWPSARDDAWERGVRRRLRPARARAGDREAARGAANLIADPRDRLPGHEHRLHHPAPPRAAPVSLPRSRHAVRGGERRRGPRRGPEQEWQPAL